MPKKSEEKSKREPAVAEAAEAPKKISSGEYEKKIAELAKKGLTSEKIGEALRKEGIHPKENGKISRILRAKGMYIAPDVKNVEAKLERNRAHYEKNKQDKRAFKDREKIIGNLRKLKKYYDKKSYSAVAA